MSEPNKPKTLAEIDLKNMPPVPADAFKRPAQLKYRIEVVMKDSQKNVIFEVNNGEEAARFVDSYQKMVEQKSALARWSIGMDLYSIPMDNVLFVRMAKPSAQEMIDAGSN